MPGYRAFVIILIFFAVTFQPGRVVVAQSTAEVSRPTIVHEFIETEFQIYQFEVSSISRFSYLLVSDNQAIVIDPVRDVGAYLEWAEQLGATWVGVLLTHSHTDFVAGHREMALATGAPIYLSHRSRALFPHMQLKEGDHISIGQIKLEIAETPGHTLDSLLAFVSTTSRAVAQTYAFAGDNFPVNGTVRFEPYPHSISAAELATKYFDSWRHKVSRLAANTILLSSRYCCWAPALTSDAKATYATVAAVRAENPIVNSDSRNEFIAQVLIDAVVLSANLPSILKLNLQGPPIIPSPEMGDRINEFSVIPRFKNTKIIDVRSGADYLRGHIKASISLPLDGCLETVGNAILSDSERIVVVGSQSQVKEAALRLARIGLKVDHILWDEYLLAGAPIATLSEMTATELSERLNDNSAPLIIDVRKPVEFGNGRIPTAINIPLIELEQKAQKMIDKSEEILLVCTNSYRSAAAMGILNGQGFDFVTHVAGGMQSWLGSNSRQMSFTSHIRCPQKGCSTMDPLGLITAAQLHDLWHNNPEKLEIIDIRSREKIEDYNPFEVSVQSQNNVYYEQLDANKQAIIVSDNVAEAIAYGGKLALRTDNDIKILQGGLGAWWYYSKLKSLKLLDEENLQLLQFEDSYRIPAHNKFGYSDTREGENATNE